MRCLRSFYLKALTKKILEFLNVADVITSNDHIIDMEKNQNGAHWACTPRLCKGHSIFLDQVTSFLLLFT
jgi:hypothetical protein